MALSKGKRVAALCVLSFMAGMVYFTPFLRYTYYDQMMVALQLSDVQIGTLGACYGVMSIIGYLPGGFFAEKFEARTLLIVSALGMCLSTAWYALFPGFIALCIIHCLYGCFSIVTFWSAYLKAIRYLGTEDEQSRLYGLSEGIRGIFSAALAFGCLALIGVTASMTVGFRMLLIVNAVVFALLGVAVKFCVPSSQEIEGGRQAQEALGQHVSVGRVFTSSLKSKSIWMCVFVIICGFTVYTTTYGYMGTYCTRILGISSGVSSALSIIRNYIVVLFAGVLGGVWLDKFSTRGKGLIVFFTLCIATMVSVWASSSAVLVCAALTLVMGFMANMIKGTYWSILGEAGIPPEDTGMATGVISTVAFLPDVFSAPVVSRFLAFGEAQGNLALGFNITFIWIIVWAIGGIAASFILMRYTEKRRKADPSFGREVIER